jgi:ribonuclease HI
MSHDRAEGRYRLRADGAARGNPGPAAFGFVLEGPDGAPVAEGAEAFGHATNNVAEYRGLLAGLESALALGVRELEIQLDSELVVRQLTGRYRVKNAGLKPLFGRAVALLARFAAWSAQHVPREANRRADELANRALDGLPIPSWPRASTRREAGTRMREESAR